MAEVERCLNSALRGTACLIGVYLASSPCVVRGGTTAKAQERRAKSESLKKSPDTMRELMAKYGMEMLGPPIFASSWMQQHS